MTKLMLRKLKKLRKEQPLKLSLFKRKSEKLPRSFPLRHLRLILLDSLMVSALIVNLLIIFVPKVDVPTQAAIRVVPTICALDVGEEVIGQMPVHSKINRVLLQDQKELFEFQQDAIASGFVQGKLRANLPFWA